MTNWNIDHYHIPVFSSYKKRENQVSHGLAVTLDQCLEFRQAFIKSIVSFLPKDHPLINISKARLSKHTRISIQSYFGGKGFEDDEKEINKTIPDILIYWDNDEFFCDDRPPCIVIETKVEASWDKKQAENHQLFAKKSGYDPIGVAIATIDIQKPDLPNKWYSYSWAKIYELAKSIEQKNSFWSYQLVQLLEITEAKLMGLPTFNGTLTKFTGIPFADKDIKYNPVEARIVARLLIKSLLEKKKDLKKIGVHITEPKTISSGSDGSIWFEADTLPFFTNLLGTSYKAPHLNFTIGTDEFSCGLTFPNSSFNKIFRKGIKQLDDEGLVHAELIKLINRLSKLRPLKIKYTPYCYLLQQNYRSQKSVPKQDALLKVDLRTLTGHEGSDRKLKIKQNTVWIDLLTKAILDKGHQSHLQGGFGVSVPYESVNQKFFSSPGATISLIIKTWSALLPLAKKIASR